MLNIEMESLLCDEVLFDNASPETEYDEEDDMVNNNGDFNMLPPVMYDPSEEEIEQAFVVILKKEMSYMPPLGYVDYLNSNIFIRKQRAKAVCWLIKSQRRLGLSLGTLCNATNYLDRFIANNKCHEWSSWMFELLSIACLSVAAKFNETSIARLCQFQASDLGHYFEWGLIQRMEFTLLKAIEWRLTPTTPFSYVEMLTWSLRSMNSNLSNEFINRVTGLLLNVLLEYEYLEFRPLAIAMSVIKFASDEEVTFKNYKADWLQHLHLSGDAQDYVVKEELLKCQEMMKKKQAIIENRSLSDYCYCRCKNINGGDGGGSGPSSPVTVLSTAADDHFNTCSCGGGGKSKCDDSDLINNRITQVQ